MIKYQNEEVKEKYIDYNISILNKLNQIKDEMKKLHSYDKQIGKINYACVGDLVRIDEDLAEILNYL